MVRKNMYTTPNAAAMSLYLSVILHDSIVSAGAVRDLVYTMLTQERQSIQKTVGMFNMAGNAVLDASDNIGADFATALSAAMKAQDPAEDAITKITVEEIEGRMASLPYYGTNQAAATAFAVNFPNEASDLANGSTELDHFRKLVRIFKDSKSGSPAGWPLKGPELNTFKMESNAVASRTARAAVADCGNAFAIAAAAQTVMTNHIPKHLNKFLKTKASRTCLEISAAMTEAGAPQKLVTEIVTGMLDGMRMYKHDWIEAGGEVSVRAVRAAHHWAAKAAAQATFYTRYAFAAGGAWAASRDRNRFESTHDWAIDAAAGVDRVIDYALDKLSEYSWKTRPNEPLHEDTWRIFSKISGRTTSEWAKIAQNVDYKATATATENAFLIETYTRAHDGAMEIIDNKLKKLEKI